MGVVMLVLLRMTIGWHFLYAGLWKLDQPDFQSSGFLSQAKGPLAGYFHDLVDDYRGSRRIDPEWNHDRIDNYLKRFEQHYDLTDQQRRVAGEATATYKQQVDEYLATPEVAEALSDYTHEWERLEALKNSPHRDAPYVQKRIWDKQSELLDESSEWIGHLDNIFDNYQTALYGVLTQDQRDKNGPLVDPVTRRFNMDQFVTWTNIAVGACLMVGLFTRLAAFGGGVFLLLIVLAQPDWPGLYPAPHPAVGRSFIVTKEFVEMMALFALACLPVGRWGGLDFFIHHLITRPLFGRKATS